MSAELRELVELARELKFLLESLSTTEIKTTKSQISELNDLWTTYLALARKSGLPDDMMQAFVSIQQMRVAAQSLITSIHALNIALASGPGGWLAGAAAAGGIIISGLMLADQVEIRRGNF